LLNSAAIAIPAMSSITQPDIHRNTLAAGHPLQMTPIPALQIFNN